MKREHIPERIAGEGTNGQGAVAADFQVPGRASAKKQGRRTGFALLTVLAMLTLFLILVFQ